MCQYYFVFFGIHSNVHKCPVASVSAVMVMWIFSYVVAKCTKKSFKWSIVCYATSIFGNSYSVCAVGKITIHIEFNYIYSIFGAKNLPFAIHRVKIWFHIYFFLMDFLYICRSEIFLFNGILALGSAEDIAESSKWYLL